MKVKVLSVSNDSFPGEGGTLVTAVKLLYTDEQGTAKEISGYGPGITPALAWKAGEEQEIEPYTTKKGKPAFRLPGGGGGRGGGGGGFAAAYRNTAEGHASEQERMDRRTALMQAVALSGSQQIAILNTADDFYNWLRKTANGKS